MQRRSLLVWFGRSIYLACVAVVAGPTAWFIAARNRRSASGPLRQRVARLDELRPGEPRLVSVLGTRQNAWTRYRSEVVGRVWIVRDSPVSVPPERTKLTVLSAVCPHGGCPVAEARVKGFVCHCHGAKYQLSGDKVPDSPGYINASPRGMDPLPYEMVQDEGATQWWVVVEYQQFEVGIPDRVQQA